MPETEYIRARERIINGGESYNVNHPDRVDGGGEILTLAKELESAIPGKINKVICNGTEIKIVCSSALTAGEESTMDSTIATHKTNA